MKNLILRGKSLTEWNCVTILSCVKEIHPAEVRAVDGRGLAKRGK
jgi:hypothetical protein